MSFGGAEDMAILIQVHVSEDGSFGGICMPRANSCRDVREGAAGRVRAVGGRPRYCTVFVSSGALG